jgi:pilus assembly protein CpaB
MFTAPVDDPYSDRCVSIQLASRAVTKARLVVLLIAVAAGVGAIWFSGQLAPATVQVPVAAAPTTEVLVAAKTLDPGQRLEGADLKWQPWPAEAVPAGSLARASNGNAMTRLEGAFVRSSILAGEPVREDKLIKAEGSGYMAAIIRPGMRAIATEISPETGVGGFVLPNDRVDVLLTRAEKGGQGKDIFVTETILYDVRVLAIDQAVGEKADQKVVLGKIATLELDPRQAERLALARRLGTLSLALRGLSDQSGGKMAGRDLIERSETIDIVRFGVGMSTAIK